MVEAANGRAPLSLAVGVSPHRKVCCVPGRLGSWRGCSCALAPPAADADLDIDLRLNLSRIDFERQPIPWLTTTDTGLDSPLIVHTGYSFGEPIIPLDPSYRPRKNDPRLLLSGSAGLFFTSYSRRTVDHRTLFIRKHGELICMGGPNDH